MNRKPRSLCIDRTALPRALAVCCLAAISSNAAGQPLFVSDRISPITNEYTTRIEGPAVNAAGDLFVVNIAIPGTAHPATDGGAIGKVKKGTTKSELFAMLPPGGIGNGIRFDLQGRMYVADFKKNRIHVFDPGSSTPQPYFSAPPNNNGKPAFNQPNDLAIARDGTLYASDPGADGSGRIWKITRDSSGKVTGEIMTSSAQRKQGKTNGLDLSPDNRTLYVSESRFKKNGVVKAKAGVYAYRINGLKLADEFKVFEASDGLDVDGLRVDTDGRIFVARPEAGVVAILVPPGSAGAAHPDVPTKGKNPTNLTFGGADGRDVYITQADENDRFIERFRTDRPGREPCLLTPPPADCRAVGP